MGVAAGGIRDGRTRGADRRRLALRHRDPAGDGGPQCGGARRRIARPVSDRGQSRRRDRRCGDIYGDGVNIAARLEALAEPGGVCISRTVRDQIRDKLLYVFDDMGERKVKNIARPLRVYALSAVAVDEVHPVIAPARPRPARRRTTPRQELPRLSIVILPFANLSNDPDQEYFADGITDDLTTDLSRISGSFVIARTTAFTYKGKPIDVKQIGRELGVRYVLEGSVPRTGDQVRMNAPADRCWRKQHTSLGRRLDAGGAKARRKRQAKSPAVWPGPSILRS